MSGAAAVVPGGSDGPRDPHEPPDPDGHGVRAEPATRGASRECLARRPRPLRLRFDGAPPLRGARFASRRAGHRVPRRRRES